MAVVLKPCQGVAQRVGWRARAWLAHRVMTAADWIARHPAIDAMVQRPLRAFPRLQSRLTTLLDGWATSGGTNRKALGAPVCVEDLTPSARRVYLDICEARDAGSKAPQRRTPA